MNTKSIITIVFLVLLYIPSYAQERNQEGQDVKREINTKDAPRGGQLQQSAAHRPSYTPNYVISEKILPYFFVNNEIPSGFPKFDGSKSHSENKKTAVNWAKSNPQLIKEEYRSQLSDPNLADKKIDLTPEHKKKYVHNDQDYILPDAQLSKYFISGDIPESFPLYDYTQDKSHNKQIVLRWYNANGHLVKQESKQEIESYLK